MEENFLTLVASIVDVDRSTLTLETKLETIPDWDSLTNVQLFAEICEEYGVDIPIDALPNIKTLRQYFDYIQTA